MENQRDPQPADEFVSLVSHEIRNALTSIAGFTSLARDGVQNHDDHLTLDSLNVVHLESQRLLRLVEDLLDLAQLSTGRFSVEIEPVDLGEIVWDVAGRYSKPTHRKIEVNVTERFPYIFGDPVRLTQVVDNLLSTATKYSPPETSIRVDLAGSESRLILSIWNDGTAIPPAEVPQMFQHFSRSTNVRAMDAAGKEIRGNGLGLFISRQITELHGGSMAVFSKDGEGTTFTVELPRERHSLLQLRCDEPGENDELQSQPPFEMI